MATIDDQWRSPIGDQIAARWGVAEGQAFFLRGSANFIFVLKKDGKKYVLRFNEDTERDRELIEAELELLCVLKNKGIDVSEPVQSSSGNWVETVQTELGTFHAVVFTYVEGNHPEFDELTNRDFEKWGKALGTLHQRVKESLNFRELKRPDFRDQFTFIRKILPTSEKAALHELDQLSEWAESLEMNSENYGVIHFDFELDNLLWTTEQIGMIDFDDSIYHWFVADIAFALRDLFEERIDVTKPEFIAFMNGYQSVTDVDAKLINELPQFMRMHHLFMFARLFRSVDLTEADENPEWLNGLISKFNAKLNHYREGFIM